LTSLQIEILTGANAGRKLLLRQTRITFGRSTDRTLPIDLPFISREHGEFAFTDGKWTLVNHSNNGTSLNGKLVTTKPRPIKNIATISLGDTDIFRVLPMLGDADQITDTQDTPDATTPTTTNAPGSTNPRGKLWAGIGVFWLVAFGLIAFGLLNQSDTATTTPDDSIPPALTVAEITQDITHKPEKQTPDARRADTALAQAHESYALIDRRPDALYRAYDAYRQALTYSIDDTLPDAQDQRQFYILEKRLVENVTQKYESAVNLLKSRQYEAADKAFKDLREFYPDSASQVFTDALKREAAARDALEKKRRG
jgi:pSer/pThr/pTyr-binding forkhead associated (FHA) protein